MAASTRTVTIEKEIGEKEVAVTEAKGNIEVAVRKGVKCGTVMSAYESLFLSAETIKKYLIELHPSCKPMPRPHPGPVSAGVYGAHE